MPEVSDSIAMSSAGFHNDRRTVAIDVYEKMAGHKEVLGGDGSYAFLTGADNQGAVDEIGPGFGHGRDVVPTGIGFLLSSNPIEFLRN